MDFIQRIINWNKARYEQEYNSSLTFSLLYEEVDELNEAIDKVDELDALVDITYIAIGAMWKMGLSKEQIEQAINIVCDSNDSKSITKTPSDVKANIDKGITYIPPEPRLQELLNE